MMMQLPGWKQKQPDKVFNKEFSAINLCQFPLEIAAMTKTGCVN